ncbi:MAG: IS21-like element helper ATPase IstB, partial [Pseudonocardiaceae bacterium]
MTLEMPAPTMLPDDVEQLLRQLKMPHARQIAAELFHTARIQRWEPIEALKALLTEETAGRARAALEARRKAAKFPTGLTFASWNEEFSTIPPATQH